MTHRIVLSAACAALLVSCSPKRFEVTDPGIAASSEAELVARGEYLFHGVAHCTACHTANDEGVKIRGGDRPAPIGGHVWQMGPLGTLRSANITSDVETGVGKWSDADLARVLKSAVRPDGTMSVFMRLGVGTLADDDIQALVSYMRTLPAQSNAVPPHEVGLLGRMVLGGLEPRTDEGRLAKAPPMEASVERGKYLANGPAACVGCHSPADGFALKAGKEFSGASEPMPSAIKEKKQKFRAPNLTPAQTGIAGAWNEETFLERFKAGPVHEGSPMPWGNYMNMREDDVRAIWMYLKTLPAIENNTGPMVIND